MNKLTLTNDSLCVALVGFMISFHLLPTLSSLFIVKELLIDVLFFFIRFTMKSKLFLEAYNVVFPYLQVCISAFLLFI